MYFWKMTLVGSAAGVATVACVVCAQTTQTQGSWVPPPGIVFDAGSDVLPLPGGQQRQ
jgi:hypothetical protein